MTIRRRLVTLSPLHLVLVLVAALFVIAPLLQPGYTWGAHDARHDVYFIFQYDKSVEDGIWLPRWSPDFTFGYGYPFFIVYGPLSTFVGVLLHRFLAFGYEDSVKAALALSILASGLGMYGFVRSWLGRNAGLVAAVAYMAIPYHLVDVFVRAALAESVALVFLPLALWGFREVVIRPRLAAILGAGAAYAALMWTSNLVALIFTPALTAYVAILLYWRQHDEREDAALHDARSASFDCVQHTTPDSAQLPMPGATPRPMKAAEAAPMPPERRAWEPDPLFSGQPDPLFSGQLPMPGATPRPMKAAEAAPMPPERRAWEPDPLFSGQDAPLRSGRLRFSFFVFRYLAPPALALLLGLGLSAAFFVPALVEQGYINRTQWFGAYYNPTQHFVYFFQLFSPAWGFGISQPGPDDAALGSMSYQLGAAPFLLSLIAVVRAAKSIVSQIKIRASRSGLEASAGFFSRREQPAKAANPEDRLSIYGRREVWFWAAWALVSILLTLPISALAWRYLPIVPYAQFPWRYLMLAMIPLSILPATLVGSWRVEVGSWRLEASGWRSEIGDAPASSFQLPASSLTWPTLLLSALLLLSSSPYLKIEMRAPTPEQGPVSYAALMRFQRTSDEMTGVTAWVDPEKRPRWSDMAELWVQGKEVMTRVDYSRVPQNRTLAVNSENVGSAHEEVYFYAQGPGQSITFNRFWYPGWTAYLLDGKGGRPVRTLPLERENGPLARIVVPVPAGEGYILLRFEDTPLRAAATWITLATLALVAAIVLIRAARWLRPFVAKSRPQ